MKTIGLLGGTTWESTLEYYRIINKEANVKLGGHNSATIAMVSVNLEEVETFINNNRFKALTEFIISNAKRVEAAGAECLVICANTMHMLADEVQQAISIPLIHITDATASAIKQKGYSKVGLLGTKFTMEQSFYKDRLKEKHNIEAIIPNDEDRSFINHVIVDEFFSGIFSPQSKKKILDIINSLVTQGAQGIILGCTEIPLLIKQSDTNVFLFDTIEIHAKAAVEFALK